MQMHRGEQPSWLGPAVAAVLALIVIGIVALLWMTVFAGEHEQSEGAGARSRTAVVRPLT